MSIEERVPLSDPWSRQRRADPKRITVTINETCRITGLGRTKVYELIGQRKLKAVAIGRRRLVVYSSIEELMHQV
jgi:excisionase family DNA binding protein